MFFLQYKVVRFIISGSIAALVLFLSLYILREVFGIWYLAASTISFILTLITSFFLQKYWTFDNKRLDVIRKQIGLYGIISLVNLGVNIVGMYFLVGILGLWYFLAQIIITALIACSQFFLYYYIVFLPNE